ncbi:translocation/assembly module TamB [Flavobacteriaceae bacterium]|nr:translocation/assembly module TamB [Flavobacteriaceae bacterium]
MLVTSCILFFLNKENIEQRILSNISSKITSTLNSNLEISNIDFKYNGEIIVNNLNILDHKNDTLISIEEIRTSILNSTNILTSKTKLNSLNLSGGLIKLNKYKEDSLTNFQIFLNKIKSDSNRPSNNLKLNLKNLIIDDFSISLYNESNIINKLNDFKLSASNLSIDENSTSVDINQINFIDNYNLNVTKGNTAILFDKSGLYVNNILLETPNSIVNADVEVLDFNASSFLKNTLKIKLSNSTISTNDVNLYYDTLINDEFIEFSSFLEGSLADSFIGDLDFKFGSSSNAKIEFELKDVLNNIKFNTTIESFYTSYKDLTKFPDISNYNIPKFLDSTKYISLTGECNYFNNTLVNKYRVITDFGELNIDINLMNFLSKSLESKLFGTVKFKDFVFSTSELFNTDVKTSADFIIDGTVLSNQTLDSSLNGVISELTVGDKVFKNILINGRTNNNVFTGNIYSKNQDLNFDFNGLVDYSESLKKLNFTADIENYKIDIGKNFKGGLVINLQGISAEDLTGSIMFTDSYYNNYDKNYFFENIKVYTLFESDERVIKIDSESINGFVKGDIDNLRNRLKESILFNLYNNNALISSKSNVKTVFKFDIDDDLISILYPDLNFGKNTVISGVIDDNINNFKLDVLSSNIKLNQYVADSVYLSIDNSLKSNNFSFKANNIVFAGNNLQQIQLNKSSYKVLSNVEMKVLTKENDTLHSDINYFVENDILNFGKNNSQFISNNNSWSISLDSLTNYDIKNKILNINKLSLLSGNEKVDIALNYNTNSFNSIKLLFDNVKIENLPLNTYNFSGVLDGDFLYEKNSDNESNLYFKNLTLDKYILGDLDLNVNHNQKEFKFKSFLKNNSKVQLTTFGSFIYDGIDQKLDLIAKFDNLSINSLNIFGKNNINNIRGNITGLIEIKNVLNTPEYTGDIYFNNSGLYVPYTEVDYTFGNKSKVSLINNQFIFSDIFFSDTKFNSRGVLNGIISHRNFKNWLLDLNIDSERLLVLNTKDVDNPVYYGTAFVSGDISIAGPGESLKFMSNVSSEKGTVFNIPLNDSKDFTENISYIKFANKRTNNITDNSIFNKINGIELDFDLNLNRNAEIEILIDRSSGSTIKGYGDGNLIMEINNKGKFNMFGEFTVDNGKYNFVYAGLLKKEFELKKGGTLSWSGDPKKALINLNTSYSKIEANPSILLDSPINLRIPVNVNVNLYGELLNPIPEFELEFPNVDSSINNELQYRLNDKESNQFQALSLLATGTFQNDINFNQQALFGNLAESAASIINNILFDENDKLKFGLNYQIGENNPDFESNDELGVTMTTKLSDDIFINGKLGVPIGGVTESVIAGDFEIELKLNEDRTLTMKIFNRENTIRNLGEQIGYTQGVGISYKVEFNSFKKLLNKLLVNPN